MSREQDLEQLKNLVFGNKRTIYINWAEEGGCTVDRVNDMYVMHEVPQYGGEPSYVGIYHKSQFEELLTVAYSFT